MNRWDKVMIHVRRGIGRPVSVSIIVLRIIHNLKSMDYLFAIFHVVFSNDNLKCDTMERRKLYYKES